MTSLIMALFLWLIGGCFGLHHLYLKRPYHAMTWLVTCGGFGLGLMWDLFEISNYTNECLSWSHYVRQATKWRPPKCSMIRFVGQILVGSWFGFLSLAVVPPDWWHDKFLSVASTALSGMAIGWGVHIVGNIGLQQRKLLPALSIAVTVSLATVRYFESGNGIIWAACLSALIANRGVAWRTDQRQLSSKIYLGHCFLYCSMWFFVVCNNGQIYHDGKLQPITVAGLHYAKNFNWNDFLTDIQSGASYFDQNSLDLLLKDLAIILKNIFLIHTVANPRQIDEAYEILGVSRFSQMKTIRSECRNLMRKYHPDKIHDSIDQEFAKQKFVEIQQACEVLARTTTIHETSV